MMTWLKRKNNIEKTTRDSNFEVLRLLAIGLVITSHFNYHQFLFNDLPLELNANMALKLLFSVGAIANIIFVILTGYFMIKSRPNYKKVIKLILEMFFYSILILLAVNFFTGYKITFSDIRDSLLPFPFGNWFCVAYIILYLLIPYINKLMSRLEKKENLRLILVYTLIFSIIPFVTFWSYFSKFAIFPLAYMVGAYIRLYVGKIDRRKTFRWLVIFSSIMFIAVIGTYLVSILLQDRRIFTQSTYFLTKNHSPLVFAISISIFLLFRDTKIKPMPVINNLAMSSLGVYLIHDNVLLRQMIWYKWFAIDINTPTPAFIMLAMIKITSIFTICLLIDQLRIKLIGDIENRAVDMIYDVGAKYCFKIKNRLNKLTKTKK